MEWCLLKACWMIHVFLLDLMLGWFRCCKTCSHTEGDCFNAIPLRSLNMMFCLLQPFLNWRFGTNIADPLVFMAEQMKEEKAIRILWRHWEVLGMPGRQHERIAGAVRRLCWSTHWLVNQGWKKTSEWPSKGGKEATTSPTSTRQEVERCQIIGGRRGQAPDASEFLQQFRLAVYEIVKFPSSSWVVLLWQVQNLWNQKCNDMCLLNKGKPCLILWLQLLTDLRPLLGTLLVWGCPVLYVAV